MFGTAFDYQVVRFFSLPELLWGCQGCSSWEHLIPWHRPRPSIPPPSPRVGPFSPSTHSWACCNYWNQAARKYLSKQHGFGINHSFNLTESDPTPLAATSPLPSHPRSRCRVSEGNETCSLALPGKSLFKWSAIELVGILGSKTGFLENEIAPGTGKSIRRFTEVGWIRWHLGGRRYFSFLIILIWRDYKLSSFQR